MDIHFISIHGQHGRVIICTCQAQAFNGVFFFSRSSVKILTFTNFFIFTIYECASMHILHGLYVLCVGTGTNI